jgi:hypothetical protein
MNQTIKNFEVVLLLLEKYIRIISFTMLMDLKKIGLNK